MNAEVLTIGNEILSGRVVDTNSAFLGRRLEETGIPLEWITSAKDTKEAISQALRNALERAKVIIVTGGLGPTHDDITKNAFAEYFGRTLKLDKDILEQVRQRFAHRGLEMPEINKNQALVPEGMVVLQNDWGTAPGLYLEHNEHHIFLLPGVPREMKGIFEKRIVPILSKVSPPQIIRHRTLRTTGISESGLFERLSHIEEQDGLAFLPQVTGVDVHITVRGEDAQVVEAKLHAIEQKIRARVGAFIYGMAEEELEEIVGRQLRALGWKIAVAESCTGGLIACRLTNISGSSDYFDRGVTTYSNRSKMELLEISEATLTQYGAVSAETVSAMAIGVRKLAGAQVGLAVTGIAGPTGGTSEKPIGLVFVSLSTQKGTSVQQFQFTGDRLANKQRTAQAALEMVRQRLLREDCLATKAQRHEEGI